MMSDPATSFTYYTKTLSFLRGKKTPRRPRSSFSLVCFPFQSFLARRHLQSVSFSCTIKTCVTTSTRRLFIIPFCSCHLFSRCFTPQPLPVINSCNEIETSQKKLFILLVLGPSWYLKKALSSAHSVGACCVSPTILKNIFVMMHASDAFMSIIILLVEKQMSSDFIYLLWSG